MPSSTDPPPGEDPSSHSPPSMSSPQPRDRSRRPPSVNMPSSPLHTRASPPPSNGWDSTTPSGNSDNQSPSMSPSGPLSPSSNMGQNSFIFPIRSVFQSMAPTDSTQTTSSGEHTLQRVNSLAGTNHQRSQSRKDNRRVSVTRDSQEAPDVPGIATVTQMLEENSISGEKESTIPRPGPGRGERNAPAVATYNPKADKAIPAFNPSLSAGGQSSSSAPPAHGVFSMPILPNEKAENPFFKEPRRASEDVETLVEGRGDESTSASSGGPLPKNDSADAPGSGLTDTARPPVGQPQQAPGGVNFRDEPGQKTGEAQSFESRHAREDTVKGDSSSDHTAHPPPLNQQPVTQQPSVRAPKPHRAAGVGSARSGGLSRHRGSTTAIEVDEEGRQTLLHDYSGIVRLTELGSLPSALGTGSGTGADTGTDSRKNKSGGGNYSVPPDANMARQQLPTKANNTRDNVRDFIEKQAHTENLLDPNAPSPTPHAIVEDGPGMTGLSPLDRVTIDREGRGWADTSETNLSVMNTIEVASASKPDKETGDEDSVDEPIVTFRFEHVATDDGHHVVVGREGKLERCEDEPITTPGAVQGFGVLIVLDEDWESGRLSVRQVSENATELLGLSPRYLFKVDCFTRILTNDQEDILRDSIEYLPDSISGKGSVEQEGPQVFLLSGFGEPGSEDDEEAEEFGSEPTGRRREWTCWVAAHRPKQPTWNKVDDQGRRIEPPDLIVLEFELERDINNPLMPPFDSTQFSGGETPDSGSQTTFSVGSRTTTIASTAPRPPLAQYGSNGSATATFVPHKPGSAGSGTTIQQSFSSSLPPGAEPMGLEGSEMDMPLERIMESTTNHAKPIRALERMRRTGQHDESSSSASGSGLGMRSRGSRPRRRPPGSATGTMDVFAVLGQINEQLGAAADLDEFLKIVVGIVQDLCRFHRVLLYQFDEAYNGQVVAELVEWGKTTDLFKGLMFPAADIPAQARQLYMINKVRLLYDRSQTTARMVLRSKDDLDHPLDMTHCYLRAMSPIHVKYLANMHVRSSMSVSIMAFGQLWGLIACHSYGHHGMRVSFPVRQMMRILSDSISRNIERLSYAQRLHTRKLISTIPTQHHPTGYIVSNADDLLQIFDADSGLLVIGEGCKLLGNNEQGTAMLAIAAYLRIVKFDNLTASNHLSKDFPDLVLPRAQDTIAGLLYVPLTAKAGQDFIVFLRKGQVREVQWAGKPYKDETSDNQASLEPRKSFTMWSETVVGRSRVWTDDQLESAGVLALIYGKFIQVWREKQSVMATNQLTTILLSNTSHAVRTPLSQIINTLELALAGNIDPDTRSMLENSHQASRALLFHVHDLLDLTRIETGNETAFNDPFDIRQSIHDAVRLYETEAGRRKLDFRVKVAPDLPHYLIGDSRKIKTVISNLCANAVKYTEQGYIEVYCGLQNPEESTEVARTGYVRLEIIISDTGCGIPSEKLEAIFVTLEGAEEVTKSTENTGLGLGLAVVARIVEQLSGQLRAESEIDHGSRFFFTVQMLVHNENQAPRSRASSAHSLIPVQPRGNSSGSGGSVASLRSNDSHARSQIDTFVQDFASSHMLAPVPANDQRLLDAEERMTRPGTFPVTDSSYPVRSSKVDTESDQFSMTSPNLNSPRKPTLPLSRSVATFGRSLSYPATTSPVKRHSGPSPSPNPRSKRGAKGEQTLRVLVVEDDAINSQILQRRLRMDKHTAVAVNNGQEAVDFLRGDWDIDAVLMDIQMPIMDGRTAAQEIRKLESKMGKPPHIEPLRIDGRIPIFAVSASLYESDRTNLAQHIDGWLLKPLDFVRVRALLKALEDPSARSREVHKQGQWEKGGYLKDASGASLSRRPSESESH